MARLREFLAPYIIVMGSTFAGIGVVTFFTLACSLRHPPERPDELAEVMAARGIESVTIIHEGEYDCDVEITYTTGLKVCILDGVVSLHGLGVR